MYASKIEVGLKIGWLIFSDNGLFSFSIPRTNAPQPANTVFKKISITKELESYFKGIKVNFNAKIDWCSYTDFEKRVLEKCRQIPYGQVVSYKDLAKKSGKPKASRAVGRALEKNRLPIIIACHRVIRSDGSFGGFSYGLKTKKKLLNLETNGGKTA